MSALEPLVAPMRRCIICREPASKSALLRVVRRPDQTIDISPNADGRGAYVHRRSECLGEAASGPKHLARALRRPPTEALLLQLAEERLA